MKKNPSTHPPEGPRQLLSGLFITLGAVYLAWRGQTLDTQAPLSAAALYLVECLAYALVLWKTWALWRLQSSVAAPQPVQYEADLVVQAEAASPTVLRKSLLAALAVKGRGEVWLLDRQPSEERVRLAEELGCRYLATQTDEALGLNQVVAASSRPLLAVFSAGDAPRHGFLTETLGYFHDESLAFVQTAVAPRMEALRQDVGHIAAWEAEIAGATDNLLQQGRDARGAALMNGSGVLLRRQALEQVSGFVAGSATTRHTSLRLHAAGWRSAFHAEPLVFNVAPEAQCSPLQQAQETLAQGWQFWRQAPVLGQPGLGLAQRWSYLGAALARPLSLVVLAGMMLAPALTWSTGRWPLQVPAADWLLRALPLAGLGWWLSLELARGRRNGVQALRGRLILLGAVWGSLSSGARGGPRLGLAVLGGVNMVALAVTGWRFLDHSSVGMDAASVAGVAAGNLLLLSWALTAVVRKQAVSRTTHRFTVSLAAELVDREGQKLKGTVDDLSEHGLRFHGALLSPPRVGELMSGVLHLPGGPLAFQAEIRHLDQESGTMHLPRTLGCRITTSTADQLRLETFLYSADLPWQRLSDGPRHQTPLSRLLPASVQGPHATALDQRAWQVAQLREHVTADARPALVAVSGQVSEPDLLISPAELPENAAWILDVFGSQTLPSRGIKLQLSKELGVERAGFFSYRIEAGPMPSVPTRIAPPVDRTLLLDDLPKWDASTAPVRRRRVEIEDDYV